MTKRAKQSSEEPKRNRQKELAEVISEAPKPLGIQQLMDVYHQCKPYEALARAHQRLLGVSHRRFAEARNSMSDVRCTFSPLPDLFLWRK